MKITRAYACTAVTALAVSLSGAATTSATASPASGQSAPAAGSTGPDQAALKRIVDKLPDDWQQRRQDAMERAGIEESPFQRAVMSHLTQRLSKRQLNTLGIDPGDYECGETQLDAYIDSTLEDVDETTLLLLSMYGALDIPAYDAILHGTQDDAQHPLPSGSEQALTTTFNAASRFWDVRLNNVQLMGMDGEVLTDLNRSASTIEWMYDLGPADAVLMAEEIKELVEQDPALKDGAHPIFTMNAFAFSPEGESDPDIANQPPKMIFGSGIIDAMKALDLNKVGTTSILGHEMAHHVQYQADLFDSPLTGPEATRRTELMADAFSTYFLVHKKGMGFNPTQTLKTERAFYNVGDCSFDSDGHHGTPNQRQAASAWGAATVAYADNPMRALPSLTLAERFDDALPLIVKPDAPETVNEYRSLIQKQELVH